MALNSSPWLLIWTEKCLAQVGKDIICFASRGPYLPSVTVQIMTFATYLECAGEGKHFSQPVSASQEPTVP